MDGTRDMNIPDKKTEIMKGEIDSLIDCSCANETREKLQIFHTEMLGAEVVLHDAAVRVFCVDCGNESISIPYLEGLIAAVAMLRIKEPTKLFSKDIRFLRKAAEMKAVTLAGKLEVTPETISRWENDKAPMSAAAEKLFRLTMAEVFEDLAPCVDYSPGDILDMNVRACMSVDRSLILNLELVKCLKLNKPMNVYSLTEQEAA